MSLALDGWKQASRQVIARPFLSLAIVVTLGLGIGASSAVFSLVDGILLRPYPYREPDRLVRLETVLGESAGNSVACHHNDLGRVRAGVCRRSFLAGCPA